MQYKNNLVCKLLNNEPVEYQYDKINSSVTIKIVSGDYFRNTLWDKGQIHISFIILLAY